MPIQDFYTDFAYTDLRDPSSEDQYAWDDRQVFILLGVDKVYFSGDFPAILFKEVPDFSDDILLQIARIQHLSWNYRKVLFLFVVSRSEIRIYNCAKRPFNYENPRANIGQQLQQLEIANTKLLDTDAIQTLQLIFSRVAVDSGTLWNTENPYRDRISVQERIDRYLVKSLLDTAAALSKAGLDEDIIHSLLMRSIFIMYLEDKGAASETNLYSSILQGATSYLDLLKDKEGTYTLFSKVEEHFNGHVFPLIKGEKKKVTSAHLSLIRSCLHDGVINSGVVSLFGDWRLFRFDIIQIELLSEIYEHFLEAFQSQNKQQSGQYYTPPALVDLILNEQLPAHSSTLWKHRVLDPACGSGIFLVESFNRLVRRWKNAHPGKDPRFSDLRQILVDNIFGIEIDRFAIRVTTFSLYLALLEHLNPRTLWKDRRYKFPYLICDLADRTIQHQGKNLFRQDTIAPNMASDTFGRIDLVVGNPPFGASIGLSSIREYCEKHGFGQDMVVPFLHKAIGFSPNGSIALIFNTKILTNTERPFQRFRQWLFQEVYVEKIYNFSIFRKAPKSFGGQLFSSAVGPVSILFYRKAPKGPPSAKIEYWAPRTYVKNTLVDGVVIDATDIKFLPREECAKPSGKIWKVGMWGSLEDFALLSRLDRRKRLSSFLTEQKASVAVGLRFLSNATGSPIRDNDIPKLPYVHPESIKRYYTEPQNFVPVASAMSEASAEIYRKIQKLASHQQLKTINLFRRIGKDKNVYYGPHLLVKSGLSDKRICASYIEQDCSFDDKVLGIRLESVELMKVLAALINSKFATWYLFLVSASVGIEREEIKNNELYELPMPDDPALIDQVSSLMDQILDAKRQSIFTTDTSDLESRIDEHIYTAFGISANERILIEDFYHLTVDLLFEGHKSRSLRPVADKDNRLYAAYLADQLNKFLSGNGFSANPGIYELYGKPPLNLITLTFGQSAKKMEVSGEQQYSEALETINRHTLRRYARNVYIQKQVRYFDGDTVYIVKPNQKRFWSRSAAVNDAKDLIHEILKMK